MSIIGRLGFIIVLASLPFSAAAAVYKCKQPDNSYAYQDAPCELGASTQQLIMVDENRKFKVLKDEKPSPNKDVTDGQSSASQSAKADEPAASQAGPIDSAIPSQEIKANASDVGGAASAQATATDLKQSILEHPSHFMTTIVIMVVLFVVMFVICLFPVKFAAKMVGAERTGYLYCFFAVVIGVVFSAVLGVFIKWSFFSVFASALAYMWVLKTSYVKGILISILVYIFYIVIPILIILGLVGMIGIHHAI